MSRILTIVALVLVSRVGWGQSLDDEERRFDLLRAHHARLEQQLAEQGKRISRLKAQPAGVGRDYQLDAALRQSQQTAERLTQLVGRLRQAHASLIGSYQRAIAGAPVDGPRAALRQRLAARALPRAEGRPRIVTADTASPNASPEDLEVKADLLDDSEEKVRVQVRRMGQRLAQLEHRAQLQRHASAAEDSPFVETAPRRTSRTFASREASPAADDAKPQPGGGGSPMAPSPGTASPPAAKNNSPDPAPAPPSASEGLDSDASRGSYATAARPPSGGGTWACSGSACADPGVTVSVTTRDALDPSLLDKLGQVGSSGDIHERIAALKRAAGELDRLAGKLSARASSLRQRATQLRRRK